MLNARGTPECLHEFFIRFPGGASLVSWRVWIAGTPGAGLPGGDVVGRHLFFFRDGRMPELRLIRDEIAIQTFRAWSEPGIVDSIRVWQVGGSFDNPGFFQDFRFLTGSLP